MNDLPKFAEFFNSLSSKQYENLTDIPNSLLDEINKSSGDLGTKIGLSEKIVSLAVALNVVHAYHNWLNDELRKLK